MFYYILTINEHGARLNIYDSDLYYIFILHVQCYFSYCPKLFSFFLSHRKYFFKRKTSTSKRTIHEVPSNSDGQYLNTNVSKYVFEYICVFKNVLLLHPITCI